MHVGEELREARLARGLSLEQVSATTKVTFAMLNAIERNNVIGMPLVYLRGYVREFAKHVGLDPDDVTSRYIAQFETSDIAQFETSTAQPAPMPPETASDDGVTPSFADLPIAREWPMRDEPRLEMLLEPSTMLRVSAGPRRVRPAVLVLAALAAAELGFLIGWSGSRGSMWVDAPAVAERTEANAAADEIRADTVRAEQAAGADPSLPPAQATTATPTRGETDAAALAAESTSSGTREAATNLDGEWTLSNEVQSSSLATFRGLRLEYRLRLQQNGAHVTGEGEKISENGRPLRRSARTPITLAGTIDGDRVSLTFLEKGRKRESGGTFQLQLIEDGTLRGAFESDAARSRGQAVARRAR